MTVLDGSASLVWLVEPAAELVETHRAVWRVLEDGEGHNPWHQPGRWTPHLSLALRFRDADWTLVRAVVGAVSAGSFVAAAVTTARPVGAALAGYGG